jgi:hypothetical protein
MFAITQRLFRSGILWARNREGMNQDEARKLFFQFRRKDVLRQPEPEEEPPEEEQRDSEVQAQMVSFMRETSDKLDRIEDDIDYLKKQVDQIIKKI